MANKIYKSTSYFHQLLMNNEVNVYKQYEQ